MDAFPSFADGDVRIVVSEEHQYKLHSAILKSNSTTLRALLAGATRAPLSTKAAKKGAPAYQLELVKNQLASGLPDVEYVFRAVELDSNGRSLEEPDEASFFRLVELDAASRRRNDGDNEDSHEVPQVAKAFDAVIGAFYNINIELGDFQDDPLTHILDASLKITRVAEYLSCVHIITRPIEATLLPTGQNLYHAISTLPTPWLTFAYRIKSKAIFKEALIHAAGQWNTAGVQEAVADGRLPGKVLEILEAKANFIRSGVIMAERHLASYYPSMLMRERTVGLVGSDNIGRANYANDIIMWMALTVFRHWCSDMMATDQTHNSRDMGYGFMRAISIGGNEYLSRDVLQNQFHQRFPMSHKGMACVEHRLNEIKDIVKQWAMPLMRSNTELDNSRFPAKYFTHINVQNTDYLWEHDGDEDMSEVQDEAYLDGDEGNASADEGDFGGNDIEEAAGDVRDSPMAMDEEIEDGNGSDRESSSSSEIQEIRTRENAPAPTSRGSEHGGDDDFDDFTEIKSEAGTSYYGGMTHLNEMTRLGAQRLSDAIEYGGAMNDNAAADSPSYAGKGKAIDTDNPIGYSRRELDAANTLANLRSRHSGRSMNMGATDGDTEIYEDEEWQKLYFEAAKIEARTHEHANKVMREWDARNGGPI